MACYEDWTKELVLSKYKEKGIFAGDTIIHNDLTGIVCPGVQFLDVTIKQSSLDKALLSEMVCTHVIIEQTNWNSVQAVDSRIQNSGFIQCHSIQADFSHAVIHKTYFEKCTAHSIRFTGARITESVFSECQMYKARFDQSILMKVEFHPGEKGDLATLQKTTFTHSMIIDCSFSGINLIGAGFGNSVFIGCDFTGAQLDEIDLTESSFVHCVFDKQILPGSVFP